MASFASVKDWLRGITRGMNEAVKSVIFALIAAVVVIGGYYLWTHVIHNKQNGQPPAAVAPKQFEQAQNKSATKFLSSGDTETYQLAQSTVAKQYLINNDPTNALRVMNDLFAKVPETKIDASTYMVMVSTEKAVGDTAQYKNYLQLLVNKLKATGNGSEAAVYQKLLDAK